jgi:hypothetical protein
MCGTPQALNPVDCFYFDGQDAMVVSFSICEAPTVSPALGTAHL